MVKRGVKRPLEVSSTAAAVIEVKRSEVPEYLRSGAFYLSLRDEDDENDEPFVVPCDAMKSDATISNSEELIHLLKSLRFWGVDGVVPEVVEFILANKSTIKLKSSLAAFESDYPYLFTLRKFVRNLSSDEFEIAVEVGDLDIVKYLHCKRSADIDDFFPSLAARHGHLPCLTYLHENGYPWGEDIVPAAVAGGSVECLKYLQQHVPDFTDKIATGDYCFHIKKEMIDGVIYCYHQNANIPCTAGAFLCEGLKSLKYCLAQGMKPDEFVIAIAAKENRFDCVKYLHAQDCPWDAGACLEAAMQGNLSMLKYMHENGCPWDTNTTFGAAQCGWLPCLKYAYENGCPWDSRAYDNLPEDSAIYKYLHQHECPHPEPAFW